jgi:hypothetical protein
MPSDAISANCVQPKYGTRISQTAKMFKGVSQELLGKRVYIENG